MTVCIAAICQGPGTTYVITATDQKLTAGDVQFEPPQPKVWHLGPGIAALIAGDVDAQSEIYMRAIESRPHTVLEARDSYCQAVSEYNLAHAERKVLAPFGLTMKSFLADQQRMSPGFVDQLRREIANQKAEIETIICGVDDRGAQLYMIDSDGLPYCHSAIGFVAIGDGARHASSQFMFAKYTPAWQVERALLLLYAAKKHAQVAPGVGEETGMFFIDLARGVQPLNVLLCHALQTQHENIGKATKLALDKAEDEIFRFFDQPVEHSGANAAQANSGSTQVIEASDSAPPEQVT